MVTQPSHICISLIANDAGGKTLYNGIKNAFKLRKGYHGNHVIYVELSCSIQVYLSYHRSLKHNCLVFGNKMVHFDEWTHVCPVFLSCLKSCFSFKSDSNPFLKFTFKTVTTHITALPDHLQLHSGLLIGIASYKRCISHTSCTLMFVVQNMFN